MIDNLADRWRGNGSGPTFPEFWHVQFLGKDFDRSILDLYSTTPVAPMVTQECTICHESFRLPAEGNTVMIDPTKPPICPKCTT